MKVENWLGHEIRFVEVDGGWWAVGNDITRALGYSDYRTIVKRLDSKYKLRRQIVHAGQSRELTIINERGIYEAILNPEKTKKN